VSHTYRIPRSAKVANGVFSAIWIGSVILGAQSEPPDSLVFLVLALLPLAYFFVFTEVTLADDGGCEFRSAIRTRRIRAQRMTAIRGDEESVYFHHDRGKIHMWEPADFDDLLSRLLALNPAIELKGWVQGRHEAIAKARSTPLVRHVNHQSRE
jgi:hypothetical protein